MDYHHLSNITQKKIKKKKLLRGSVVFWGQNFTFGDFYFSEMKKNA
jgi:hypothetical protein